MKPARATLTICVFLGIVCALAEGALGPRYGGTLTIGLPELVSSLEPSAPASAADALVLGLIHETLVGISPDGLPTPSLAETWSSAASGQEWTLVLRRGASFHDGRPVTAADAVRSLTRFARNGSTASAWLTSVLAEGRGSIDAVDERHLVLRLMRPTSRPLAPLASPAAAITGPSGTGCGPFNPVHLVPARRLTLTAFSDHVRGRPFLDRLELTAFADRSALRIEQQTGRMDVVPGDGGVSSLSACLLLVLDSKHPPFADQNLRNGVAAAVNRADLVRHFLPGGSAQGSLLAPLLLPVPVEAPPPPPAALDGGLTIVVARTVPPLASQRVAASLSALGMQVTVQPQDPPAALAAAAPARLLLWTPEVPEAGLALEELTRLIPFDREVREILDAARTETDTDRRRGRLLRAEAALRRLNTVIGLAAAPISYTVRRGINDARVTSGGRLVLEDCWMEP